MWNSIPVVCGNKQSTGQVDIQEGPIEAALDDAKEGKKERDEKNDCQQTHLPICLNYHLSTGRNAQPVLRITFGDSQPALIRSDP
jgi:hypothetical protein